MAIQTKNPATLEIIKTFTELTPEELSEKINKAQDAFLAWKETTFTERKNLMLKLASYLRKHSNEFCLMQSIEMGKTISSGPLGIERCALLCEYYAKNAEKILSNEIVNIDAKKRYVEFDPLGIVLAVMPWNFPFWQVYRFAIPALMAGNVGILKHASNVPQCAEMIEKSFKEAGFPKDVFQNLLISSSLVENVIRDTRVMAVALTGSEKAGSDVARIAGNEIKKTVLELGGSDPFIVFPDVDIPLVAKMAITARLQGNTGQSCISAKRFIVHKSIADEFTKEIVAQISKLVIGNPLLPTTDIGPLATESIMLGIEKQVNESILQGAKIAYGGKRTGDVGYFYLPTVMTNIKKGMPVYDEEVFGPVMPIILFEEESEAIKIANDTPYGLGASIWTKDIEKAKKIIPKINTGNVFVNNIVKSDPRTPFGGIKKSGYGRELSAYGIKEFVNIKNVSIE